MTEPSKQTLRTFWKVILPIFVILGLIFGSLFVIKSRLPKSSGTAERFELKMGSELPDLTLDRFGSGPIKISELKAKVLLVNFWATWCEACMIEMPSFVKLRNQFKDKGLEIAGINLDEEPNTVIPKAIKQLGINFPVFVDNSGKVAEIFDVHAIPLTVIVDRNRRVLFIETGERDWNSNDIQSQVKKWLSE